MTYSVNIDPIGKTVELTEDKISCAGILHKGSIVTITEYSPRGYTFEDELGNRITEAGFAGFKYLELH